MCELNFILGGLKNGAFAVIASGSSYRSTFNWEEGPESA